MSGIAGISDGPAGPTTGSTKRPNLSDIDWGAQAEVRTEAAPERRKGEPPTFIVFKTETCPWCHRTMDFLKALHEHRGDFRVAVVDANANSAEFRKATSYTRRTTVPQVFLDGRFVGGWDDLARAAKRGQLDAYLDGEDWEMPKAEADAKPARWAFWKRRHGSEPSSG